MHYIMDIPVPYRNFVVMIGVILVALVMTKVMFHILEDL